MPKIVAAGSMVLLLGGCVATDCDFEPVQRQVSPDGRHELLVAVGSCGATTDFSTHVYLLPSGQASPSSPGNVLVADTDHGRAPAAAWGGPIVSATWADATHAVLAYDPSTRVFRAERALDGITITHRRETIVAEATMPSPTD